MDQEHQETTETKEKHMKCELSMSHECFVGEFKVKITGFPPDETVKIHGKGPYNQADIPMSHWPKIVEAVEKLKPLMGRLEAF